MLAGFAALLALIADAVSDPLVGQVSDNWKGRKWGRRHPFMFVAIIPGQSSETPIGAPTPLRS